MNLFSFTANFGTEADYRNHFKKQKDLQGACCLKYKKTAHYWKQDCGATNAKNVNTGPHYKKEQ